MGLASGLAGQEPAEEPDLEEVNRKLDNPLTTLWSLTFQENLSLLKGDALAKTEVGNLFFFQPALPVPVGESLVLIARPVFPLVTSPVPQASDDGVESSHQTGLGDIQLFTAIGPSKVTGLVWGAGATFKFPTATDEVLGDGKWQAGPVAMLFHFNKEWSIGTLIQHWWSFAGDPERASTSQTDFQYVVRRQLPGAWSIGMGPTISIDWKAESGNKVTFPIGLGVTKTFRVGSTPIKTRLEPQYSIIRPDDVGTAWNFRLQFAPVIKSPFTGN